MRQEPCERAAHAARANDRHGAAGERARAEGVPKARPQRRLHAGGGERTRVAAATVLGGPAHDVLGPLAQAGHVRAGGADVLGGDVAAPEQLDGLCDVVQQRGPGGASRPIGAPGQAYHGLSPSQRKLRHGGLQGHRARQPQRVRDGCLHRVVAPHATTTKRRTEHRRVRGDDRRHAAARPHADEQRLVLVRLVESAHGVRAHVLTPPLRGGCGASPETAPPAHRRAPCDPTTGTGGRSA